MGKQIADPHVNLQSPGKKYQLTEFFISQVCFCTKIATADINMPQAIRMAPKPQYSPSHRSTFTIEDFSPLPLSNITITKPIAATSICKRYPGQTMVLSSSSIFSLNSFFVYFRVQHNSLKVISSLSSGNASFSPLSSFSTNSIFEQSPFRGELESFFGLGSLLDSA